MENKLNLAVIGTGRMGSIHTRNVARLIPGANLVALCDLRLELAQALADELDVPSVTRDYHHLLTDPDIDAVMIIANTDTHAAIIRDCAEAGKHIFCEKPIALDLRSIDDALAAVKKAGVKLQIGFNRRFDKSFRRVREVTASGALGRPCILKIVNRDPELPAMNFLRTSGGMFLDMSIHDFDMARFQIGEVEELYSVGSVLVDDELKTFGDIDTSLVTLKFENGAIGNIDNSRQSVYGYDQSLEVFCLNGTVKAENEQETTLVMGDPAGMHHAKPPYWFINRYAECYVEEVRQFVEAVLEDKPVPVTGEDGRAAVVLGYAAWKSFHENRPVNIKDFLQSL